MAGRSHPVRRDCSPLIFDRAVAFFVLLKIWLFSVFRSMDARAGEGVVIYLPPPLGLHSILASYRRGPARVMLERSSFAKRNRARKSMLLDSRSYVCSSSHNPHRFC